MGTTVIPQSETQGKEPQSGAQICKKIEAEPDCNILNDSQLDQVLGVTSLGRQAATWLVQVSKETTIVSGSDHEFNWDHELQTILNVGLVLIGNAASLHIKTPAVASAGNKMYLRIENDSNVTVPTFDDNFLFPGGVVPAMGTAGEITLYEFSVVQYPGVEGRKIISTGVFVNYTAS